MQTLESHAMNESYTKRPIDSDELMTTKETAEFLRVNRATLYRWRREDISPKYYNLNGKVMYKRSDLNRYLNQNSHTSLQYR
jgi:predicted site-specific integrase-resolvase